MKSMHIKFSRYVPKYFFRYLLMGGVSACVDFFVFIMLVLFFRWVIFANIFAIGCGAYTNYTLNKKFNFYDYKSHQQYTFFKASVAFFFSLFTNSALLGLAVILFPIWVAKVVVMGLMLTINFLINERFVFAAHTSL